MKKVGLITWHYIENYGSALQCYALQTAIKNIGYEVEVINYKNDNRNYKLRKIINQFPFIVNYLKKIFLSKRLNNFNKFYNDFYSLSKLYTTKDELSKFSNNYDIYVCGSDQIWSPNLLDDAYLLSFVKSDKLKISYAPSVVIDRFTEKQKEIVKKYVSEIDCISVREPKGAKIISKIINKEVNIVLDPTFLLEEKDWNNIVIYPNISKPYILCYLLGENLYHRKLIQDFAKKVKCKIITLPFNEMDKNFGDILNDEAGPREFLGLIKNARYICTDSFHGMALSINLKKEFFIFERFREDEILCQNDRINNILDKFNINNRIIRELKDFENNSIDYKEIEDILITERKLSYNYLKESLSYKIGSNDYE